MSATTLQELAELPAPFLNLQAPPALLVLNEMSSVLSPWLDQLRARGSIVETIPFHGFDEFVRRSAFHAQAPSFVLRRVVAYLADAVGIVDQCACPPLLSPAILNLQGATETPISFGPGNGMFGILCRPDKPLCGMPAMLLPTTGIDPCSGMSRIWTDLARNLAQRGVPSLRFDMTSVGESHGTFMGDAMMASYHPDRISDLGSAVDALAARGFGRVTVVGYCSGAYAAWHAAIKDKRIEGLLAGNLIHFKLQTTLAGDLLNLQPGRSQLGLQHGLITRWLPAKTLIKLRRLDDSLRSAFPRPLRHVLRRWEADQRQTRRHLRALTARGCAVRMVMAKDDHGHARLLRAFGDRPRFPSGVELFVIPDADHQFSDRRHRAYFLQAAADFVLWRSKMQP